MAVALRWARAVAVAAAVGALAGCERGCGPGWPWVREHVFGAPQAPASLPTSVIDCPDGLGRCVEGTVFVSQLASMAWPCRGPERSCECPWETVGGCARGCVVEGLEVAVDRGRALGQLCAPEAGDPLAATMPAQPGLPASSWRAEGGDPPVGKGPTRATEARESARCDEGELYRCADGAVVDCVARAAVALCVRGCAGAGGSIDDGAGPVRREAAFAILCKRGGR
jgi:hypothetical protein